MTPAQKQVLLVIAEKGPITAAAISTYRFGHDGYALRTERVCDVLVEHGLVVRRRAGWTPTAAGRRELRSP